MTQYAGLAPELKTAPVKALLDTADEALNEACSESHQAHMHLFRAQKSRADFLETVEALRALGVTYNVSKQYADELAALRKLETPDV